MSDAERFFTRLVDVTEADADGAADPAPARLKSRLYSSLVKAQAAEAPLRSLAETRQTGARLCVFEEIVAVAPVTEELKTRNPCQVCHARVLGERMDRAPIFWPHCPYSQFHRG